MKKFIHGLFAAGALCMAGLVATSMPADARQRGDTSFSITLGNAQFGYTDGYYDSGRRWHRWRNHNERRWYQRNHRQSYYQMRHHHDRDQYRRDWRNGRRDDWRRNH